MRWSTACPDWEERIVAGRSLIPLAPLFQAEADAALAVFKGLQVVDLPQKADGTWPTLGEACEDWVFEFVATIFGAYDTGSAKRLIREFLLLISKKNAKSTIAAGIMITALVRNWRYHAELLILAPTREIANNSFDPAAGMVRADPELSQLLQVIDHQRTIRHLVTFAELKVVAADSEVVGGKKAAFVLVEELWLFGKRDKATAMLREATGGLVSRREGFVIFITTHSDEAPAGVYAEKLNYFRGVRDGEIPDPTSMGVLFEWPRAMLESEAFRNPANFYVTNPNLGRSVSQEWLEDELRKELRGDGEGLQIFLAKHLNVEIGLRLRRDRWRGADHWPGASFEPIQSLDALLDRVEVAVVTVDGGGLDDLLGLCVAGRDKRTGIWLYWCHAFAHRKVLKLRQDIATELRGFEADGDLTFWGDADIAVNVAKRLNESGQEEEFIERPKGKEADPDIGTIVEICVKVRDRGLLPESSGIGVDPAAIGALVDALVDAGFSAGGDGVKADIMGVAQSAVSMNSAITTLERKLEAGNAAHGGTRLMNWCVGNAKVEQRGNAILITKQAAGKAKIDPLIACFIATKLLERNPEASGLSVYDQLAKQQEQEAA